MNELKAQFLREQEEKDVKAFFDVSLKIALMLVPTAFGITFVLYKSCGADNPPTFAASTLVSTATFFASAITSCTHSCRNKKWQKDDTRTQHAYKESYGSV